MAENGAPDAKITPDPPENSSKSQYHKTFPTQLGDPNLK